MKNFLLFLLLLVFSLTGLAQDNTTDSPKRFCASVMIGGSFPGGDFYDNLPDHSLPSPNGYANEGVKINLLDLTYRLNRNFGLAFSWTKLFHEKDEFLFDRDFYFGTGYLAGLMFFTGIERKYMVGLKFMTGYGTTKMRDTELTSSDLAYNPGVFLYHDFNEIWRLMGSADIYYTSMEVEHRNEMKTLGIRSTSFSVGIGLRF